MNSIQPGGWIGIMGGGQLGRMMALAAKEVAYRVVVWDPDDDCPAADIADRHLAAEYTDPRALAEFAESVGVATYEFENVNADVVEELSRTVPVFPNPRLLRVSQNRVREKETCRELGLDTAPFVPVLSRADLDRALATLEGPTVLKTATGGYDGKGQAIISAVSGALSHYEALGGETRPMILEKKIAFQKELSIVVARDQQGDVRFYPTAHNYHRHGILDISVVPAGVSPRVSQKIQNDAHQIAERLDLVGVMAIEFFLTDDDRVLVNEMAPRPHNSGHYTLDACETSQFDQHIRAICGLPLGFSGLIGPCAMINLLGDVWHLADGQPNFARALQVPGSHLHLYGKRDPRSGRKMGHITVLAETTELALERVREAKARLFE